MHFDDFIAQQVGGTRRPTTIDGRAARAGRDVLEALWRGVRQFAWGIDAYSRVRHGIDVPPDHGAHRRPATPCSH